jgi:hypothetical protein
VEPCRINVCYYETKGDHVSVKYSTEPCGNDESGNYVVPPGTVLSIDVTPKTRPLLSNLHLDVSKYEKYEDPEILGLVHYKSANEGLYLEVDLGLVQDMTYFAMKKDDYLRCPPRKQSPKTQPTPKVEGSRQPSNKHRRHCYLRSTL